MKWLHALWFTEFTVYTLYTEFVFKFTGWSRLTGYKHWCRKGYGSQLINNEDGAAGWLSGLARLSFVLRVRGSNPCVDTREKGKKEQITFHLFRIVLCILSALTCLWTRIWTSMAYLAPSMEWSPIVEHW
jgi:hypothetical protein